MIGRQDLVRRPLRVCLQLRCPIQGEVDFLIREAEIGPAEIVLDRLLGPAGVAVAFRQLEGMVREQDWVGFRQQCALQHRGVFAIGHGLRGFGRRDRDRAARHRGRGFSFPHLVDRDVVAEAVAVFAGLRYDLALLYRA